MLYIRFEADHEKLFPIRKPIKGIKRKLSNEEPSIIKDQTIAKGPETFLAIASSPEIAITKLIDRLYWLESLSRTNHSLEESDEYEKYLLKSY